MASESGKPSLLARFLDSFLQEANIKWMLGVGMLILLSSSLLLVTMHWGELPPFWKYLVFLTYTMAAFATGQWSYHRLGLRRTGTVLQGLTVLLVPILFLVLHWVPHDSPALAGLHVLLVAGTFAFSVPAVRMIFNHFLRQQQTTFLVCYLTLALAGAALPGFPAAWSPAVSLALWAVFAIGTVKVNRHVFWLTEEHHAPRICGFLPMALLGGQFLTLFILHGAPQVPLPWLGLACVLVAAPVLLTADAVAAVFQQRTGDLVRPLPWAIMLPLIAGLILIAGGVVLAGAGLTPPSRPQALVVTAALAAGLLGLVAHRTGKQAFVWAMLVLVTTAYIFSPGFFGDLVRVALQQGAQLVQEDKLPYAFYGLTCLPLILTLMFAATRASVPFVLPLRHFCLGFSALLMMVSLGHFKAILPVSLVMVAVFTLQTRLFRDWRPAVAAIVAWFLAAFGFVPFLHQFGLYLPMLDVFSCVTIAAALLLIVSPRLDPLLATLRSPLPGTPGRGAGGEGSRNSMQQSLCRSASLLVTCGLALCWLLHGFHTLSVETAWSGLAIGVLLLIHAANRVEHLLGAIGLLFCYVLVVQQSLAWKLPLDVLLPLITLLLLAQWLLSYALEKYPHTRIARAFAPANQDIATCGLTALWIGLYCPLFLVHLARPFVPQLAFSPSTAALLTIDFPCGVLMLIWAFDAARRHRNLALSILSSVAIFLVSGSLWIQFAGPDAWQWAPAIWAIVALLCLSISELLQRRGQHLLPIDEDRAVTYRLFELPLIFVTLGVLCLIEIGSLLYFSMPMRVAGFLALIGLVMFAILRRRSGVRIPALVVVNWQVLCLTVQLAVPELATLFDLRASHVVSLCLPIALVSAASLVFWNMITASWNLFAIAQRTALYALLLTTLMHSVEMQHLTEIQALCAAGAFLLFAVAEILAGCRQQFEARVWLAEAIFVIGVGYLLHFGVLHLGEGVGMFVLLGLAFVCWIIKQVATQRPDLHALVRPLHWAGYVLPMIAVGLGIYRHMFAPPTWLGANSLALLLAAGFYFWRGIEQGQKSLVLLAGLILNVALVLLWRELVWTDPQFFMVPIGLSILALVQWLRDEIPVKVHNPLRYLGALVILVSPTFHIVGGSWLHLFCLMVASVGVILLAIGLRVRALVYTGTAFLLADLAALVVTGSMANANVLWIAGLALGAGVIGLAAYCERHREILVQRMHLLSESMRAWE